MQIIAENLAIDRGGRTVIDDLSFTVASGEALVLSGSNGAGKTTLLRSIAGFLPLSHGSIRLAGGDNDKSLAEQVHIVGHANAAKANLTVSENLAFWSQFLSSRPPSGGRVAAALKHFGLAGLADFPVAFLSAGQRRRAGLARLLAVDRPIWLLDEPTASLDAASSELLSRAVNLHTHAGGIAIVATHLPLAIDRARELNLDKLRQAA